MVTVNQRQKNNLLTQKFDFNAWLEHLQPHRPEADIHQLRQVYALMEGIVHHQQHISGETEIQRALNVADILAGLKVDTETLVATMLHSLIESSVITVEDIRQQFGDKVAEIVIGVEKMRVVDAYHIHQINESQGRQHLESVRKLLLALAQDVRVVLIKLAERLHLMRVLRGVAEPIQQQLAQETQDIFAPLASRLGIWQLKWELEDLAFRYLTPQEYQQVAEMLDERRVDRESYITNVTTVLHDALLRAGVHAEVTGRPKHIYSIWRKMQRKGISFREVFDVRATRVLVNSVADCYAVLGIVHSLWQPIRSEFDDYIATPKKNDYQSLHTAVIGPGNKTLEIQIRTYDMHQHCEFGVAAHWRYKEGGKANARYQEKIAWLRHLLEWKDTDDSQVDLIDQFKAEIFEDRVYALTPKGQVVDLPKGSTTLDFAYAIHTDVGHHFRGAKVDGRIVPMGYVLTNGQQVEILVSKQAQPSRDWLSPHLGYISSPRTRAKIRQWFKLQNYQDNVVSGRSVLEKELNRLGARAVSHEYIAGKLHFYKVEDLLAAVGRGDVSTTQIANVVLEQLFPDAKVAKQAPVSPRILKPRRIGPQSTAVEISGVGGLATKLALCCKPVPDDDITGYITRGRGVSIHRQDCKNLLRLRAAEPERLIEVSWGRSASHSYLVDIHVTAFDRQGLLRDITNILSNSELNVIAVNTNTNRQTHIADMVLTLELDRIEQLSGALAKIETLPNVMQVSRKTSKS